ncbi:MAG TPA: arginine--tRNA ligase [Candidatus Binatia bacterium]|nr:arginine--tRNA ligase [Candidatus Binatia bacterium]
MKAQLRGLIAGALAKAHEAGDLASGEVPAFVVEVPRDLEHGDLASNVAMLLARPEKKSPRALADIIVRHIGDGGGVLAKVEPAGPGFLNFTLSDAAWRQRLLEIVEAGDSYGTCEIGSGQRVQVEFCSANPTGPLHIGHGRGAVTGDAIARLLDAAGYEVDREYYVNDAGVQIETLGRSVLARYRELCGFEEPFPEDGYPGDYVFDLAREVLDRDGRRWLEVPKDEAVGVLARQAADRLLENIRADLEAFGARIDHFTSELSLRDEGRVEAAIEDLRRRGHIYEQDGATWMRTTAFDDDKDRPVVKSDGGLTYFACDIAYHREKVLKGYDRIINVWGADHHGYVSRIRGCLQALGLEPDKLRVVLVQMVSLSRDGEPVRMGKRTGEFIPLRAVVDEVGNDLARFFFLSRKSDAHLDFDLELARRQTAENPVFYVQYAHTRIAGIFRQAAERGIDSPEPSIDAVLALSHPDEIALIKILAEFPEIVAGAAEALEPHRVIFYAQKVAGDFHRFYAKHRCVSDDGALTAARLLLVGAVGQVIGRALRLVGIAAPERM